MSSVVKNGQEVSQKGMQTSIFPDDENLNTIDKIEDYDKSTYKSPRSPDPI